MWRGHVPVQRNPLELSPCQGPVSARESPAASSLTSFRSWCHIFTSRSSDCSRLCCLWATHIGAIGLKWRDVDWLKGRLTVERGIVRQIVDEVKTENSDTAMTIAPELLAVLKAWKQATEFAGADDWIFASPVQLGRLPFSYTGVLHVFQKAAAKAGIGLIGTHTMRHTYRSWLDAVGTTIAVQAKKMMRHVDIRTGDEYLRRDAVTDELIQGRVGK